MAKRKAVNSDAVVVSNVEKEINMIIKKNDVDADKFEPMIKRFSNYAKIADEWRAKAESIVVTDASQTAEMDMAATAYRYIRGLQIDVERTRKELKGEYLRGGRAVDGIAHYFEYLLTPIADHLKQQKDFIKIQQEKEDARILAEAKAELARKEEIRLEAERKEQERIRKENARLRKEAEEKEAQIRKERAEAEARQKAIEEQARKEREKAEKSRLEAERLAKEEREKLLRESAEKEEKARKERERLEEELRNQITCPKCGHKFKLEK